MLRELYEALELLDASQTRARVSGTARVRGRTGSGRVVDLRDPLAGLGRTGNDARPGRPGADWVRDDPRW